MKARTRETRDGPVRRHSGARCARGLGPRRASRADDCDNESLGTGPRDWPTLLLETENRSLEARIRRYPWAFFSELIGTALGSKNYLFLNINLYTNAHTNVPFY
jgi:hypothetical protein